MKSQDRDQSMDRLLRQRAARDRAQGPGVCLDADVVAAWTDGALTPDERAAAEGHAADCARCQALLAAMVRTGLPATPVEASGSRVRRWLSWLTPVAAAATALALWVAVDQMKPPTLEPPPAPSARAPVAPPVDVAGKVSSNAPPVETESRASTPKETDTDSRYRSGDRKDAFARSQLAARDNERVAEKPAEGILADALKRSDPQGRGLVPAPASSPVKTPAAPPPPAAPRAAPPAALAETVTVQSGTPAVQTAKTPAQNATQNAAQNAAQNAQPQTTQTQTATQAGQTQQQARTGQDAQAAARQRAVAEQVVVDSRRADAAGRGAGGGGAAGARAAEPAREEALRMQEVARDAVGAVLQVISPDPSVRWRILDGRTVQRSSDGGASWQAEKVEIVRPITAGAAPSTSVCWLVGQNGLVMLTTDGRTWQQIAFPQFTALKEVRATDARTATITTADGRVFATDDGGKSWTQK